MPRFVGRPGGRNLDDARGLLGRDGVAAPTRALLVTVSAARRSVAVVALAGAMVALVAVLARDVRAATDLFIVAGDVGAGVAVSDAGSAFLVSGGTQPESRRLSSVRVRSAAPGARFGPARTLMRSTRTDRAVDAGVASDGSGVIALQTADRGRRRVRATMFDRRGLVGRAVAVSGGNASDFAALDVARSGAAVLVWFRHRRDGWWRLEASVRDPAASAFGAAEPVSAFLRRPCCTRVSAAIGERGDAAVTWSSTSRPAVWAALRTPPEGFRAPETLATDAADEPRATVGAGGTAAVIYSVQHVPRRASDGLKLHRAASGGPFGAAEHVNPGGGVTVGEATVTRAGRVMVAWIDTAGARVRVSEAGPGEPLVDAGALGTNVTGHGLAVAADDDGRAVVAWPQLVSTAPVYRERTVGALRSATGAPFRPAVALGRPWRAVEPEMARLVPRGGAFVVWKGSRFRGPTRRRTALAVSRLP
jgi:hypothetical protein